MAPLLVTREDSVSPTVPSIQHFPLPIKELGLGSLVRNVSGRNPDKLGT